MRVVRLVTAREFGERLRSKAFLVSNLVIMALLVVAVLAPALFSDDDPVRIGHLPGAAVDIAQVAAAQAEVFDIDVEAVAMVDRGEAEDALRAGDADVVVLDDQTVLVERAIGTTLESLLASAAGAIQINESLEGVGIPLDERTDLLQVTPLEVEVVAGADDPVDVTAPNVVVTYFGVFMLYGLLAVYGQWVAQGIVEEKQSRVVEVLLSSIRPTELLVGKVVGLGLLGLAQIVLMAGVGATGLLLSDTIQIDAAGWRSLALVLPWYVLGYLLYAAMFAMAGAVVARVEDLQSAVMPVIAVLVLALLAANVAIADPHSTTATVAGIFPLTAPIMQPILLAVGASSALEVVLAIVLAAVAIALLMPLAGRIYRGGVLRTRGRVSYRDAWRSSRAR